jgi:uncharacterized membrane protein
MKRTILIILLVVSLSMNVAVGGTVIWNLWRGPQTAVTPDTTEETSLNKDDVRQITAAWPRDRRAEMMEIRQRIQDKKLEVLEVITKNPGNLKTAEEKIDELVQLKGQMEKKALTRISEIMATLPQEKRTAFFGFLRNRACMGPGMGHGMMRPGMGRGMMRRGMGRGMMGPGMGR